MSCVRYCQKVNTVTCIKENIKNKKCARNST